MGVALIYATVVAALYFAQARILFSGCRSQGKAVARLKPPQGTRLLRLSARSGTSITALFGPALTPAGRVRADRACRPTVIMFYGSGSWLRDEVPLFQIFRRLGVNVLAPEYAGYGLSGGAPSEAGCYAAAEAAWEHLASRSDVDPRKIVLFGYSLGGAVAIDLAAHRPAAGAVVVNTFTSAREMAARQYPFVPVSLLLRHRFESEQKVRRVRCPLLVCTGMRDDYTPTTMSDRLAAAASGPVERLRIYRAGHSDFFGAGGQAAVSGIRRFLDRIARAASEELERD